MRGEVALAEVYAERMAAVRPTRAEVVELGREYIAKTESGAQAALTTLENAGLRIVLVSAGLREAILPLAKSVGVSESNVHAVSVYFTDRGEYAGFDMASPLTQNGGKAIVVRNLNLPRPILAVGDGVTDAEMKTVDPPAVDAFAAYTGVVERAPVVSVADYTIKSFEELLALILGADVG